MGECSSNLQRQDIEFLDLIDMDLARAMEREVILAQMQSMSHLFS